MRPTSMMRARCYARAFLNVFYPTIERTYLNKIRALHAFFCTYRRALSIILFESLAGVDKLKSAHMVFDYFKLGNPEERLLKSLITAQDITLLPQILESIVIVGYERLNILQCYIESSHELSKEQQGSIIGLMEHLTKMTLDSTFEINPDLICGIAMISKNFAWEKSIARRIKTVENHIRLKGCLK